MRRNKQTLPGSSCTSLLWRIPCQNQNRQWLSFRLVKGKSSWKGGEEREVGEGGILRVPVPTPSLASSPSKSINPSKKCLIKKYIFQELSTKKFLNYLRESTRNSNNVVILLNSRNKAKQNKTNKQKTRRNKKFTHFTF